MGGRSMEFGLMRSAAKKADKPVVYSIRKREEGNFLVQASSCGTKVVKRMKHPLLTRPRSGWRAAVFEEGEGDMGSDKYSRLTINEVIQFIPSSWQKTRETI